VNYDNIQGKLGSAILENKSLHTGKHQFVFDTGKIQSSAAMYLVKIVVNDQVKFLRIIDSERD